jgi:hypothetical protein
VLLVLLELVFQRPAAGDVAAYAEDRSIRPSSSNTALAQSATQM